MTTTSLVVQYLDDLLDTANVPDYPNAVNGLELANSGSVMRVAAAVDFSLRTVQAAALDGATMLLVHHGMFWGGVQPITGTAHERLRTLISNDIAVYASHLPLDRHALYGNNALLAAELGLEPSGEFARFRTIYIGVAGTADVTTTELVKRADAFARRHGGSVRTTPISPERRTTSWAICTGAGASTETLAEARERGIDTLIVGEGPHHSAVDADESGIAVIYAGHYATETLGVCALAAHVSDRFGVPWTFIEAPTGL
ncbi:MAG: Nif3-like dinuclear metal center hexameric protein [Gemmatimonadota bacterium]|nr:Nif3-like dinuclear metal center hexameric protein [Gemmatimonadota bacterium]